MLFCNGGCIPFPQHGDLTDWRREGLLEAGSAPQYLYLLILYSTSILRLLCYFPTINTLHQTH
jgi:hypothetical protein